MGAFPPATGERVRFNGRSPPIRPFRIRPPESLNLRVMTHRRAGRLAVLVAALALAAGCTGGGAPGPNQASGPTQTPGSQSPTATASPTVDALEQARADLRSAQDTYYRAYLDAVADPKNTQRVTRLLAVYVPGPDRDLERLYLKLMRTPAR